VESLFGKHHCSVCGHRVGRFLTLRETHPSTAENMEKHGFSCRFEMLNVDHYSCPFCGATDRDRLFAHYLEEELGRKHGGNDIRIVDFAPVKSLSVFLRRKLESLGCSYVYRTADLFNQYVDDRVDIMDMRIYKDGQFNFFICSHVLEHVPDDRKALRELFRITQPSGAGIVMAPISLDAEEIDEDPAISNEAEAWRRFGQNDHVRIYSRKGFVERLEEAGFQVWQYGVDRFGARAFDELAIAHGSILYVVTRSAKV